MKFKDSFTYKTTGGGKYTTDIPLDKRTFDNIPKYANGMLKVKFQDWLHIKGQGGGKRSNGMTAPHSYGKSEADGKWYGWSHRAVYGFKAGDKITGDNSGKKVVYPKLSDGTTDFDNGKYEDDFVIKDDEHAKQVAMTFADNVG